MLKMNLMILIPLLLFNLPEATDSIDVCIKGIHSSIKQEYDSIRLVDPSVTAFDCATSTVLPSTSPELTSTPTSPTTEALTTSQDEITTMPLTSTRETTTEQHTSTVSFTTKDEDTTTEDPKTTSLASTTVPVTTTEDPKTTQGLTTQDETTVTTTESETPSTLTDKQTTTDDVKTSTDQIRTESVSETTAMIPSTDVASKGLETMPTTKKDIASTVSQRPSIQSDTAEVTSTLGTEPFSSTPKDIRETTLFDDVEAMTTQPDDSRTSSSTTTVNDLKSTTVNEEWTTNFPTTEDSEFATVPEIDKAATARRDESTADTTVTQSLTTDNASKKTTNVSTADQVTVTHPKDASTLPTTNSNIDDLISSSETETTPTTEMSTKNDKIETSSSYSTILGVSTKKTVNVPTTVELKFSESGKSETTSSQKLETAVTSDITMISTKAKHLLKSSTKSGTKEATTPLTTQSSRLSTVVPVSTESAKLADSTVQPANSNDQIITKPRNTNAIPTTEVNRSTEIVTKSTHQALVRTTNSALPTVLSSSRQSTYKTTTIKKTDHSMGNSETSFKMSTVSDVQQDFIPGIPSVETSTNPSFSDSKSSTTEKSIIDSKDKQSLPSDEATTVKSEDLETATTEQDLLETAANSFAQLSENYSWDSVQYFDRFLSKPSLAAIIMIVSLLFQKGMWAFTSWTIKKKIVCAVSFCQQVRLAALLMVSTMLLFINCRFIMERPILSGLYLYVNNLLYVVACQSFFAELIFSSLVLSGANLNRFEESTLFEKDSKAQILFSKSVYVAHSSLGHLNLSKESSFSTMIVLFCCFYALYGLYIGFWAIFVRIVHREWFLTSLLKADQQDPELMEQILKERAFLLPLLLPLLTGRWMTATISADQPSDDNENLELLVSIGYSLVSFVYGQLSYSPSFDDILWLAHRNGLNWLSKMVPVVTADELQTKEEIRSKRYGVPYSGLAVDDVRHPLNKPEYISEERQLFIWRRFNRTYLEFLTNPTTYIDRDNVLVTPFNFEFVELDEHYEQNRHYIKIVNDWWTETRKVEEQRLSLWSAHLDNKLNMARENPMTTSEILETFPEFLEGLHKTWAPHIVELVKQEGQLAALEDDSDSPLYTGPSKCFLAGLPGLKTYLHLNYYEVFIRCRSSELEKMRRAAKERRPSRELRRMV